MVYLFVGVLQMVLELFQKGFKIFMRLMQGHIIA